MGKVCKKSWIAAIFLGVMLFAAGFAFQASTVDAQAATTGFRTVKGKTYYYKNGKKVGHVAIYIGDGEVIHSSNEKDGVKISKMNYRTPYCIRRIL